MSIERRAHQRDFVRLITQMLTIPTTAYKNVLIVLGLENYLPVCSPPYSSVFFLVPFHQGKLSFETFSHLCTRGPGSFPQLFEMLPYMSRKSVALGFAKSALKFGHHLTTLEEANRMFAYLRPLLQSEEDQPPEDELDEVPHMRICIYMCVCAYCISICRFSLYKTPSW